MAVLSRLKSADDDELLQRLTNRRKVNPHTTEAERRITLQSCDSTVKMNVLFCHCQDESTAPYYVASPSVVTVCTHTLLHIVHFL